MLVNPTVETLLADDKMANAGTLEIIPLEQPLTLFVWSKSRVVPVRLTDFSITEEAFDPNLNPIRAKVSLGLRVLSVDDLGFASPGGHIFMTYLGNKEQVASQATSVAISVLGLGGLPYRDRRAGRSRGDGERRRDQRISVDLQHRQAIAPCRFSFCLPAACRYSSCEWCWWRPSMAWRMC